MNSNPQQLALALYDDQRHGLACFVEPGGHELVAPLLAWAGALLKQAPVLACIHGPAGSGKSHLLRALARELPVRSLRLSPNCCQDEEAVLLSWLERLHDTPLLIIDDIHHAVGCSGIEERLFQVVNRLIESGGPTRLLCASPDPPALWPKGLADLRSRLQAGLLYSLVPLSGAEVEVALERHATARGIALSAEVKQYLEYHSRRDLPSLIELLEQLDQQSLARQRAVTVPLVRQIMQGALF